MTSFTALYWALLYLCVAAQQVSTEFMFVSQVSVSSSGVCDRVCRPPCEGGTPTHPGTRDHYT